MGVGQTYQQQISVCVYVGMPRSDFQFPFRLVLCVYVRVCMRMRMRMCVCMCVFLPEFTCTMCEQEPTEGSKE